VCIPAPASHLMHHMAEPLKKARDCDCMCRKGAAIVHVVPCCDRPVPLIRDPGPRTPSPSQK
jgi:hypothetical protein